MRPDFGHVDDAYAQSSKKSGLFGLEAANADQTEMTRVDADAVGQADQPGVAMTEQYGEWHPMHHAAWRCAGRVCIQMGVKPDQAKGALMGSGFGSALPGPDRAGVIPAQNQGFIAVADRLNDGRSQSRGVLSNHGGRRCRGVCCDPPIDANATGPARWGSDGVQSDDVDRPAQTAQPFFNAVRQKSIRAFGTARVWCANADGQHN